MNRIQPVRTASPAPPALGAEPDQKGKPLRALGWSDLDQTQDWPENFIVRPDEPGLGPPAGVALPVLTPLTDRPDLQELPDALAPTEPAQLFAPTAIGPRLRRNDVEDQEYSEFHADPEAAPESVRRPRSAFANWSFVWLVLLLLLGLAAAAWFGLPALREGG